MIHFGVGTGRDPGEHARSRRRVDRRRLADADRRSLGAHRPRSRHPGQPRPDAAARPARSGARGRRRSPGARRRTAGHIFNLGHGILPRRRSNTCRRSRDTSINDRDSIREMEAHDAPATACVRSRRAADGARHSSSLDEMPEYLRLVRGGRPPSAELVAEMRHNYAAIGGRSPLTDLTQPQAAALRRALSARCPGRGRHAQLEPVHQRSRARARRRGQSSEIVGIPLAPQFSTLSVRKYVDAATRGYPPGLTLRVACARSAITRCCSRRLRTRSPKRQPRKTTKRWSSRRTAFRLR